jgi:predicted outer membrane repeat protein
MHGKMTAASVTAATAIGVMAAAGLAAAPAVQAAAPVAVPCNPAALAAAVAGAASGATLELAHRCDYILTAALPTITGDLTINGREATLERSDSPGTPAFAILSVNGAGDSGVDSQVSDATFTGDTATTGSGGAISDNSPSSSLNLDHNRFTGNHAAGEGGAVFDVGADGQITDSTFRGNTAVFGGAIFTSQNAGEGLTGLVVHGNSATGDGGGIYEDAGLTLTDSTISRNHATADGGGIDSLGVLSAGSTQITGNRAAAGGGGIYDDGPAAAATLASSPVTSNKPDNCEPTGTITGCTS